MKVKITSVRLINWKRKSQNLKVHIMGKQLKSKFKVQVQLRTGFSNCLLTVGSPVYRVIWVKSNALGILFFQVVLKEINLSLEVRYKVNHQLAYQLVITCQ